MFEFIVMYGEVTPMRTVGAAGGTAPLLLARTAAERPSTGHRTRTTQGSTHVFACRGMQPAAKADVHRRHVPVEGMKRAYWIQYPGGCWAHDVGISNARETKVPFRMGC